MKQNGVFLAILSFAFGLAVFGIVSMQIGYYTDSDLFGPISRYPLYFLMVAFVVAFTMTLVLRRRRVSPAVIIIPLLLLFFFKYVLPDLQEPFYATNFSDSPVHLVRGLFVTKTGHSDPSLDAYFDMQPGFFWTTSIFLNTVYGVPSSLMNSFALFLAKWSHLLAIAAYLPLLYFFYKELLHDSLLVGSALLLQFAIDFLHYHYAAQSYGNGLYWLSIVFALLLLKNKDRRLPVLFLLSGFSLIFLHQGLTLFLTVMTLGTLLYPLLFRIFRRAHFYISKETLFLLVILLVSWFAYLVFYVPTTFEYFVFLSRDLAGKLLNVNLGLFSANIQRPNPLLMQIVTFKSAYMIFVIFAGLVSSFINSLRSDSDIDKAIFTIQLLTIGVIGSIAVGIGAIGYAERLLIILPLTVYSIIRLTINAKKRIRKNVILVAIAIALTTLIFMGMLFYFSGRNYQSTTYTELSQADFIITNDPNNVEGLYTKMTVLPLSYGISNGFLQGPLYTITRQDTIYSVYYVSESSSNVSRAYTNLLETGNQIYDNMIAKIVRRYSSP